MPWSDHVSPDAIAHVLIMGMSILALTAVVVAGVRSAWRGRSITPKPIRGTTRALRQPGSLRRSVQVEAVLRSKAAISTPSAPSNGRRTIAFEYDRVVGYIERTGEKVHNIHVASRSAARHIDNAEMALNRLLADVAPFMNQRLVPTVVPRRSLT